MKLNVTEEDWDEDFGDLGELPSKLTTNKAPLSLTTAPGLSVTGTPTSGTISPGSFDPSMFSGTITKLNDKKPFALLKADAPNRRSFILPSDSLKKPKV